MSSVTQATCNKAHYALVNIETAAEFAGNGELHRAFEIKRNGKRIAVAKQR